MKHLPNKPSLLLLTAISVVFPVVSTSSYNSRESSISGLWYRLECQRPMLAAEGAMRSCLVQLLLSSRSGFLFKITYGEGMGTPINWEVQKPKYHPAPHIAILSVYHMLLANLGDEDLDARRLAQAVNYDEFECQPPRQRNHVPPIARRKHTAHSRG